MGICGTSKLPKCYRTDFKHDLYQCTWPWLEMSAKNSFSHSALPPGFSDLATTLRMAISVVKFQAQGYKIRSNFG